MSHRRQELRPLKLLAHAVNALPFHLRSKRRHRPSIVQGVIDELAYSSSVLQLLLLAMLLEVKWHFSISCVFAAHRLAAHLWAYSLRHIAFNIM